MESRACPECGGDMERGHVHLRPDIGSESAVIDVWFVSDQNEDWLVLPRWDQKDAYRCVKCGTTVILRGRSCETRPLDR